MCAEQETQAEGRRGELMDVLDPALSSAPRPKPHSRGEPVEPGPVGNAGLAERGVLLLNVLAYDVIVFPGAAGARLSGELVCPRIPAALRLHAMLACTASRAARPRRPGGPALDALVARLVRLPYIDMLLDGLVAPHLRPLRCEALARFRPPSIAASLEHRAPALHSPLPTRHTASHRSADTRPARDHSVTVSSDDACV